MKRAVFTSLAGAAGAAVFARPLRAQSLTPIRFATSPVESYALALYAQERGAFRAAGLDVQFQMVAGGGGVMAAIAGNAVDLACANVGAQANAHIHGLPFAMIAGGGNYTSTSPTTVLAVAKNAPYKTAKDLNGKTVGVSTLKDLQQASVMKWVDANSGDSSTLKFTEVPSNDMPAALDAGRIDAGILLEPTLTVAKSDVRIFGKCYDAIAKTLTITTHFGNTDWLAKNPDATRAFVKVLRESAAWANANPAASSALLAKITKIDPATIAQMNRIVFAESLDPATIQPVIDATAFYKFLPNPFPVSEMFWTGKA